MMYPRSLHCSPPPAVRLVVLLIGVLALTSCQPDQRTVTGVRHGPNAAVAPASPQTLTISPSGDTYLNIDAINHDPDTTLNTYTWPANMIANAIVMKFDLGAIPAGATISSATVNLYLDSSDATTDLTYTITANQIIHFNPDVTRATGQTYDGVNPWTANSCCSGTGDYLAQADIGPAVDTKAVDKTMGFKQWNVTSIVQGWYNNPSTNFGLLLNSDPSKGADRFRFFVSSENLRVPGHQPYLTVVYTPPSGITYYQVNFADQTLGPLSFYDWSGKGSYSFSTDYVDAATGSTHSAKFTLPAMPVGTDGAAILQSYFGNGGLAQYTTDPTINQDFFEEVRFVIGPGASAAIGWPGGSGNSANQGFKTHKSVYGQAGSNTNGWDMDIGTPPDGLAQGIASEAELWGTSGAEYQWPMAQTSLNEGQVYDVVYRYHRYPATNTGTIAIWVTFNGVTTKVLDSPQQSWWGDRRGLVSGVANGTQTSTTLQDNTQNWTPNQFANDQVVLTSGPGGGLTQYTIVSNTSNTLTISGSWTSTPASSQTTYTVDVPGKSSLYPLTLFNGLVYGKGLLGPLNIYVLFTQATNYPIGPATSSP